VQGKRIDNTSVRDEPYEFVLGKGQVSGCQRALQLLCTRCTWLSVHCMQCAHNNCQH
jgi:hypothetical protein